MNTIQLECFVTVAEQSEFFQGVRGTQDHTACGQPSDPDFGGGAGCEAVSAYQQERSAYSGGHSVSSDAELILKTAYSAKERLGKHEHLISFEVGCHNHLELNLLPPVFS